MLCIIENFLHFSKKFSFFYFFYLEKLALGGKCCSGGSNIARGKKMHANLLGEGSGQAVCSGVASCSGEAEVQYCSGEGSKLTRWE
ncbi:MAG: hypothetical protein KBC30_07510 [Planctomycetes bacterium]|nr:hypothetical protein [Planctomycetota bacterium]